MAITATLAVTAAVIGMSGYTPTPLACRIGSFPSALNYTGLDGTVCAASLPPSQFDINQCCRGNVRVDDCTQWCETAYQQSLAIDSSQFSDCVQNGNNGAFVNSMCGTYEDGHQVGRGVGFSGSSETSSATTPTVVTSTASSISPFATTSYSGGLAQCEGTSLRRLDLTGLRGTICRISLSPLDISSCCAGSVRTANTCTQYCAVSNQLAGLTTSQNSFNDCVKAKNNGVGAASECGIYYGGMNGTATPQALSTVTASSTTADMPTPTLTCRTDSFPNYDTTGMNGTVCAVSIEPDALEIQSCCGGKVRVKDNCTQWCETKSQGDLFTDQTQFSDCITQKNNGNSIDQMCSVVDANESSSNGSMVEPYTGTGSTHYSSVRAGIVGGLMALACIASVL